MSAEEYLQKVEEILANPFLVKMTESTYNKIRDMAKVQGVYYPEGRLHHVLGLIHSRANRDTIYIFGIDQESKRCTIGDSSVEMCGISIGLPLGLKAISQSIKKGFVIDENNLQKSIRIESKSHLVQMAMISLFKAVVQRGLDKEGVFYNRIIDMIGESNSQVKIKAINAALKIGKRSNLIENTTNGLMDESKKILPNPVWSPAMLALLGIHIYRAKEKADEAIKKVLKIVKNYIVKVSNEKALNGLLVILWGMTKSGEKKHLPFIILLSLFSRHSEVRKSAIGIFIEYLGHNPSDRSLCLLDEIRKPVPNIKMLLKFGRISKALLISYSNLLVSEGTPLLIKRAAQLKMYAGEEYAWDAADIFSVVCALRMNISEYKKKKKRKDSTISTTVAKLTEIVSTISPKFLSPLVKIELELMKLLIKAVQRTGLATPSSRAALLHCMGKNVFTKEVLKALLVHKETIDQTFISSIGRTAKTPTTVLAAIMVKAPQIEKMDKMGVECPAIALMKGSPSYASYVYLLATQRIISPEKAKAVLFELLACYTVDPLLGDIGSYCRFDSLYLLVHACARSPEALKYELYNKRQNSVPLSVVLSQLKLPSAGIKLSKEEKKLLMQNILKLSIDKSRRLAHAIFTTILPAFQKVYPHRLLRYIFSVYTKEVQNASLDTAILAAGLKTMKRLLRAQRRKQTKSETAAPIESTAERRTTISMVLEGVLNTLISSDGSVHQKILGMEKGLFKVKNIQNLANNYLERVFGSASKNTQWKINEIRSKILI
ncbi:hypothetical protein NEPAR04_1113 [Nematocida parisii]|nr:hypothetical protein NEPAR08_0943 [Nematocida parisii]KAI5127848.1 hypothetical protein NEPAR03_1128 [Nematocida parisii]KAI5141636.1 hypothetical protein NEPAR04_1113 [Nematocida parisii]